MYQKASDLGNCPPLHIGSCAGFSLNTVNVATKTLLSGQKQGRGGGKGVVKKHCRQLHNFNGSFAQHFKGIYIIIIIIIIYMDGTNCIKVTIQVY